MAIFAAISSGLSIPLATGLNWGWKLSLIFWTIPAIIGIIIWLILSNRNQKSEQVDVQYITSDNLRIWREPLAWQVALYMGLQSTVFYVSVSWLPRSEEHTSELQSRGQLVCRLLLEIKKK